MFGQMPRFPRLRTPVLDALRVLAARVHDNTKTLNQLKEQIMANFDALNNAVAGLGTAIEEAVARIDEDFQALRDQLGNDATDQAAVDAAAEQVQASIDRLKAIDPDPNNPAPAEPTE